MRIGYIIRINTPDATGYRIGFGISPYTHSTTHYDLSHEYWNTLTEDQSLRDLLIQCKMSGSIPPNASLPHPPIKRKL